MPKRKAKHSLAQQQRRKFVSDVAKLRRAGLISKDIDPRKQDATKYMKGQIKKFADVIEGKAQAVKIKATKDKSVAQVKKEYDQFKSKGDRIVVPIRKGDKVTFSGKMGLGSSRRSHGNVYRVQFVKGLDKRNPEHLKSLQRQGYIFSIPFWHHELGRVTYRYWDDPEEMARDMNEYENYKNWQNYVEILKTVGRYRDEEMEGDDDEQF